MAITSGDEESARMVLLFWVGLLVCVSFLGLNVLLDLVDLTGIL